MSKNKLTHPIIIGINPDLYLFVRRIIIKNYGINFGIDLDFNFKACSGRNDPFSYPGLILFKTLYN